MKTEKITKTKKESIFKSKPFIAKRTEIDYKFNCKYLFFIVMTTILSVGSFFLWSLGYGLIKVSIDRVDSSSLRLNELQNTLRAIAIFTSAWTVLFAIWWLIQTIYYIKLSTRKSKWLDMFSILPIFNVITIVRLSMQISPAEFNDWLRGSFSNDKFENNPNDYLTKKWWLNFLCLFMMAPVVGFLWLREPDFDLKPTDQNFWFEGYHYFTIQTNLLCFVYIGVSVVLPRNKLHNNDSVLICLVTYISVVSVTYNGALLPINISTNAIAKWTQFQWAKTCWEHMVNPIVFVTIGLYNMYWTCTKKNTINDYGTVLKFGMIIPTIYLTYALFLPFTSGISVYGIVTNCNPNLPNGSFETGFLSHGSPVMLVCILGYLSVFAAVITLIWRIKYSFYAKVKKQNETVITTKVEQPVQPAVEVQNQ